MKFVQTLPCGWTQDWVHLFKVYSGCATVQPALPCQPRMDHRTWWPLGLSIGWIRAFPHQIWGRFPPSDLGSISGVCCQTVQNLEASGPLKALGLPPFPPFLATAVGRHSFLLVLAGVRCCRVIVGFETRSTTCCLATNLPVRDKIAVCTCKFLPCMSWR